ncbi:hypothetical protein F183_A36610 [Bryobacterales bacterium F-183]|nr:hypothetical protein F183_A36610 [Bryobacterales bacterium F-183]
MVFAFVAVSLILWGACFLAAVVLAIFRRFRVLALSLALGSTLAIALAIALPLVVDRWIPTEPGYNGNTAYVISFVAGAIIGAGTGVQLARKVSGSLLSAPQRPS